MTTEQPKSRSLLTDTILVGTVSAFAYLTAFLYEKGYCDHFGIPLGFISPNATNIFAAAVAMVSLLALVLFLLLPLGGVLKGLLGSAGETVSGNVALINFLVIGAFLLALISFGLTTRVLWLTGFVFIFYNGAFLIWILRQKKAGSSWRESIKDADLKSAASFDISFRTVEKTIGVQAFLIVSASYLLLVLAYLSGSFIASNQRDFFMLDGYPDYAILRVYGDTLISSKVDMQKRRTGSELLILRTSEIDALKLKAQKLGRLKGPETL